jgi:hypothetical protein
VRPAPRAGAPAAAFARKVDQWEQGMCQQFVRTCQDLPGGAPSANAAARAAADLGHLHSGWFPPIGVSVHFDNRRVNGDPGHVGVSLGDGLIRSTDYPRAGHVGTISIRGMVRVWFNDDPANYLGWTESNNGYRTWIDPNVSVDISKTRDALRHGSAGLKHGRIIKRQLALVLGDDGGMNLHDDQIGKPAIRAAAQVEKLWHPVHANGWLSESDVRRLGSRRNAFTTHR